MTEEAPPQAIDDPQAAPDGPQATDDPQAKDGPQAKDDPQAAPDEDTADATTELDQARTEAAGYLDDLRRLKAEFENYRKRVLKEQTALVEMASVALVEKLLPVLDNFELALIAADRTKDYEPLVRGVELVFSEFKEVLRKEGLKAIEADGRPFDPELHEAVMQGEGPAEGKPLVGEVFRTGYMLQGRVIRPAMVKVVKR